MNEKIYITTPIYYANGSPHIGHFLTTTIADVLARYYRNICGKENVYFTTGLDEHGTTVEVAAKKEGYEDYLEYTNTRALEWQKAFDDTTISYDYFVRTTNNTHERVAQEFIKKMVKNGDIYKAKYKGKYCYGCEKFLTLSDLNEQGLCPLHRADQVIEIEEDNYFFNLDKYAPIIEQKIIDNEIKIYPETKRHAILSRIALGIKEGLSISRPKEKVSWGTPFPDDDGQTIYVWVEALINYISSLEINNKNAFWDGKVIHILGKDINWFHNFIWPSFLLSAGYKLYTETFVHDFLNVEGQKISKSLGNVITPKQLSDRYGIDGARYLILANLPYKNDSNVLHELLDTKFNADLANGLGNLVARITKLVEKSAIKIRLEDLSAYWTNDSLDWEFKLQLKLDYEAFRLDLVLAHIWEKIATLDKYINEQEPWKVSDKEKLTQILNVAINELYRIAIVIEPIMPNTSKKILDIIKAESIQHKVILFERV